MDERQVALSHDGTMGAFLHGVAAAWAVLSADAGFALIVSNGAFALGQNPSERPRLVELDLTAASLTVTPLTPALLPNESVVAASLSGDSNVVVYTVDASPATASGGDNFLVVRNPGSAGSALDTSGLPPAVEPLDLELLDCHLGPAGLAGADVRLRQWRGSDRRVVLTGEIVDSAGLAPTARIAPVVQEITADGLAEFTLEAPFDGTMPTCTIRVVDGTSSHPDVTLAWRRP